MINNIDSFFNTESIYGFPSSKALKKYPEIAKELAVELILLDQKEFLGEFEQKVAIVRAYKLSEELKEQLKNNDGAWTDLQLQQMESISKIYEETIRGLDAALQFPPRNQYFEGEKPLSQSADSLIEDRLKRNLLIESVREALAILIKRRPEKFLETAKKWTIKIAFGNHLVLPTSVTSVITDLAVESVKEGHHSLTMMLKSLEFTAFEKKTGGLGHAGARTLREGIAENLGINNAGTVRLKEDSEELAASLAEQRLYRLNHLREVYLAVVNEPGQCVKTKYFPSTSAWYVGTVSDNNLPHFEIAMQRIGALHNITTLSDSKKDFEGLQGTLFLDLGSGDYPYPQDFLDFTEDEIRVPAMTVGEREAQNPIGESILHGRIERNPLWYNEHILPLGWDNAIYPFKAIPYLSRTLSLNQSVRGITLASALNVKAVMNLTYNESGNTLVGIRGDGTPYVIIGWDSYTASKALMERDLGRTLSDEEIRMAFGIDYGVDHKNIYFVEQPGDFHLDMSMAVIGPSTIALNDSVLAYQTFKDDINEILKDYKRSESHITNKNDQLLREAVFIKKFEDQTEMDLRQCGFEVIRVAGRFKYKRFRKGEVMNFFNMITATAPGGERVVIANGVIGDKYKQLFENMLRCRDANNRDACMYYLDRDQTIHSLKKEAGISCRTKSI